MTIPLIARIGGLVGNSVTGATAKRNSLYTQADVIAFNEAPMLFLFFYKDLYAVQPWIKGFTVPAVFSGQRWTDVTIQK